MKARYKKFSHIVLYSLGSLLIICISFIVFFFIRFPQFIPLVRIAPDVLGCYGKRTYLVLFQNNEELRPGGGFIGSYGIISFDKGHMSPLTIHNVYDADGLLHTHIEPYFIERRYLQVHLYMRDSNFDVDFVKSAKKVEYMLTQETGQKVDGVIAIDVSYITSLIQVVEPLYLWQYHATITAHNFFLVTEEHTDKHSFPGSTQKQDFLRNLFNAIREKITTNTVYYAFHFLEKTHEAMQQKHLLFEVNNPKLQAILTKNNVSSALYDPRMFKQGTINDFLGINEANIGVNKANYFLKRTIVHTVKLDTSGIIKEHLTITYENITQAETWPSGTYKNYIRLILPLHATIQSISINNQKQKIVPAVTDFRIYEAPGFQPPPGLEVDTSEEAGKTLYGFLVSVDPKTTKTVTITYQLPVKVNLSTISVYDLYLFKQPGMNNDPYSFTLIPPSRYVTESQKTENLPLSTDKDITISIHKI